MYPGSEKTEMNHPQSYPGNPQSYPGNPQSYSGNPPPYSGNPPVYIGQNMPPYTGYPPPGPPLQYGPTVVQATVIPGVVPMVIGHQMSSKPARRTCPSCNTDIVTRTEMKSTIRTHLFAALLCVLGFWPCVCLPYCIDSCNNVDHYCPNCNAYIGSYIS